MKILVALSFTMISLAHAGVYSDDLKAAAAAAICNPRAGNLGAEIGDKMMVSVQSEYEAEASQKGLSLAAYLKDPESFKGFVKKLDESTQVRKLNQLSPEDLILFSIDYGLRFQLFATTAYDDSLNIDAAGKLLQERLLPKINDLLTNPNSCSLTSATPTCSVENGEPGCAAGSGTVQSDRATSIDKPATPQHSKPRGAGASGQ